MDQRPNQGVLAIFGHGGLHGLAAGGIVSGMIDRIDCFAEAEGSPLRDLLVREAPIWSGVHSGLDLSLVEVDKRAQEIRFARFQWETLPEGSLTPDGVGFHLPQSSAQRLMDDLWRHGLRPTNGEPSSATTAAMEAHIADLRAMVQNLLQERAKP